MPVEVGFCDVCFDLECEDPDECDETRRAEAAEAAAEEEA